MTKLAARTGPCPTCGHTDSDLRRKVPVKTAADLNAMSEATFRRTYPHLIIQLSPNRQGVELGDAYALPAPAKK
jgi:hypothetical protein